MKQIVFIVLATALCLSKTANAQSYGQLDLGYSTQTTNLVPVFAFGFGHNFFAQLYNLTPVIEIGFRAHMDQQAGHNIYGHLSAGLQYKDYVAITAGGIAGGNQTKQDRHVLPDTVLTLTKGASSANYVSYQFAIRGMLPLVRDKETKRVRLSLFGQGTYAHAVLYGALGMRWCLKD